jgi:hypothetical protein
MESSIFVQENDFKRATEIVTLKDPQMFSSPTRQTPESNVLAIAFNPNRLRNGSSAIASLGDSTLFRKTRRVMNFKLLTHSSITGLKINLRFSNYASGTWGPPAADQPLQEITANGG